MRPKILGKALVIGIALFVVLASPAQAYVDPGSGLFLAQFLLAGLAGGIYFLRGLISKFFRSLRREKTEARK